MNNMPFPYFPNPYPKIAHPDILEEEIKRLKIEISRLKERVSTLENNLENKKNTDYLQKDDSLYMM